MNIIERTFQVAPALVGVVTNKYNAFTNPYLSHPAIFLECWPGCSLIYFISIAAIISIQY